jgi:glycosyltransferase involved in cell wall biosynthesis
MFHTVSQFSADRLAHFFPQIRSRIRYVHNGVTPHFFEPIKTEGRDFVTQAGLANRPYVLVPGGLHYRKNADLILTTARVLLRRFPDLQIVIVNHNNPVYLPAAYSLGERLKLLGFVSDSALHALYAMAKIVWFPSLYEGFGLPVVEAMACGTPVVASNSSSIPEIAGNAAILCDPKDPNAHLGAISSLLTDTLACEQFSEAGKLHAKRFTWSSSAAQLKESFDTLL